MSVELNDADSAREAQLLEQWKAYKKGFQEGIKVFNKKPKQGIAYLQVWLPHPLCCCCGQLAAPRHLSAAKHVLDVASLHGLLPLSLKQRKHVSGSHLYVALRVAMWAP